MPWNSHASIKQYSLAVALVALAATAAVRLSTAMTVPASFILFFPAVVVALSLGGVRPGILATVLSAVAGLVLITWSDRWLDLYAILSLIVFILSSALSCRMMAAGEEHTEAKGETPAPAAEEKPAEAKIDPLGVAMASAVGGIALVSEDGLFVSVNASFAATVGQAEATLVTHSILEVIYAPDRNLVTDALHQSDQTGRGEVDMRILCQGSAPVDVTLTVIRSNATEDSAHRHYCFMRDISRRKREEALQRERHSRFHEAFCRSNIGLAIVSPDGRFLEVNEALCIITGYTESELMARDFKAITHSDDLKTDMEILRRLRGGEVNHCRLSTRYIGRRSETIRVQGSITIVRDNKAKPLYFVVQVQEAAAVPAQAMMPTVAPTPPAAGVQKEMR